MGLQASHQAVVSRLRHKAGIEHQTIVLVQIRKPAILIGESPDYKRLHVRRFQEHIHELTVQTTLGFKIRLGRSLLIKANIQLRNLQSQALGLQSLSQSLHVRRRCHMIIRNMSLATNTRNVDASRLQTLGHGIHRETPLGSIGNTPFQGVVVIIKPCIRIRLVGPHESGVNKLATNVLVPHGRFTVTPCGRSAVANSLVHHVPFADLTLVMPHHIFDMILQNRKQGILGRTAILFNLRRQFRHPVGNLTVPSQGVTTNLHSVLRRISHQLIAILEVERIARRFRGVKLHLVFRNHNIELGLVGIFVHLGIIAQAIIKPVGIQNRTHKTATGLRQLTKSTIRLRGHRTGHPRAQKKNTKFHT